MTTKTREHKVEVKEREVAKAVARKTNKAMRIAKATPWK